jgi:uncharacterized membrane protein YdjX (TVP38/TMEM64 family)
MNRNAIANVIDRVGETSDLTAERRRQRRLAVAVIIVLVAAAVLASRGAGPAVEALRGAVGDGGLLAAAGFALAYAGLTVALVPGSLLTLAAGALFGIVGGTVVTIIGATAGATLSFLAARRLSQSRLEALAGPRLRGLDVRIAARGFVSVLVLRLIPVAPFNLLNYALGATSVRLRDYVAATTLGIAPASFAFAAAGAAAADPGPETAAVGLGALAVLLLGTAVARRRPGLTPS